VKQPAGPSTAGGRSWTRLDGVDLLRGLAIFFVLTNHVNMRLLFAHVPYTKGLPSQLVSSLVWNGQYGVQIFFAISGFLITSTALRRWGSLSAVSIPDFYRLRFARIAPLLFLLLALLSSLHFAGVPNFVVSAKTGGLGRALIAALTFHVNVLEASRGYLPGNWDILWSLSVEEMFYLFFPLVCRLTSKRKLMIPLMVGFVALGPFARTVFSHGNPVWREYSYLGGMDAIAMGCLTALLLRRIKVSGTAFRACAILGTALLVFILCLGNLAQKLGFERIGLDMSIVGLGACLVITAAATTQWRAPRTLTPLLRFGQRSYEVYLTHMFVVFGFFAIFVHMDKPTAGVPVLFLLVILAAGLLGELVARVYSEPMNRFLRRRWRDGPETLGSVIADRESPTRLDESARAML
jgi:peptidoglycan/LPS O-acetylase OafA/YrhL